MHLRLIFVLIGAGMCAAGAMAQQNPPAAEALKPAAFLLGNWTAEGELPGAGRFTLTRNYRNVLAGKFILASEAMQAGNAVVTREMWMGVDPARDALGAWALSSDGSVAVLSVAAGSGGALVLEGALKGGAEPGLYRSTLQRNGNDRFTQTIEAQKNGAWTGYATFSFVRADSAASPNVAGVSPQAALKPLEMMAGRWRAEGESDGTKFAVDYAIYWTLGGNFLRSDYSVTTGSQTEFQAASYVFADSESKALRQIGFSADGGVAMMKVTASPEAIKLDGEIARPSPVAAEPARPAPTRITYARPDGATLTITTEVQRQNGTWRRSATASLTRRP